MNGPHFNLARIFTFAATMEWMSLNVSFAADKDIQAAQATCE
jgi:hypothetical protein